MSFRFILALHLFGAIFWIGGLLMIASMLARVPEEVGVAKERLLVTAQRLFEMGSNPGAALTAGLGIILVLMRPDDFSERWFHAKMLLIAILLFYHVRFYRRIRFLQDNPSEPTRREFRVVHAMVSLLVFAILVLTMMRSF
ncbi:MAG TPA: CopD family protein [Candidatus Binataceae bacterium]|nr:CopD family protein [Candidatus Binataceae bacterium]